MIFFRLTVCANMNDPMSGIITEALVMDFAGPKVRTLSRKAI